MKKLIDNVGAIFLVVASVVGAGFISGREHLSFFGVNGYFLNLIISFLFFILSYIVVGFCAKQTTDFSCFCNRVFYGDKFIKISVYICCFLSSCVMASVIDGLLEFINPIKGVPVYSTLALIVVVLLSSKGEKNAKIVGLILLPIVLVSIVVVSLISPNFAVDFNVSLSPNSLVKALLYSTMNIFLNLPIIFDSVKGKTTKTMIINGVFITIILFVQSLMILSVMSGSKLQFLSTEIPFFMAIGGNKTLFNLLCLTAVLTSLMTVIYPLCQVVQKWGVVWGKSVLVTGCVLLSMVGVGIVVDFVYPVIGAVGCLFLTKCVYFLIKENSKRV